MNSERGRGRAGTMVDTASLTLLPSPTSRANARMRLTIYEGAHGEGAEATGLAAAASSGRARARQKRSGGECGSHTRLRGFRVHADPSDRPPACMPCYSHRRPEGESSPRTVRRFRRGPARPSRRRPSASGSWMWRSPKAACAAAVNAEGIPGTAAMLSPVTHEASTRSALGVASSTSRQAARPSSRATRAELQPGGRGLGYASLVAFHGQHVGAQVPQPCRRRPPDRPQAQDEHRAAGQAARGGAEGGHEAGRRGRVVVRAGAVADVEGEEAVVVGGEDGFGAARRRRPAARACPAPA